MNVMKMSAVGLLALLFLSCRTGGDLEPIVIDLSAAKTPAPSASPTPAPRTTPAAVATATTTPAPSLTEAPASMRPDLSAARTPGDVVRTRAEAYNRHDLDALLALYAADARIYETPDRLRDSGTEQIRQAYARRFAAAPGAKITVAQRMTEGNFVVDHEVVTGGGAQPESAVVISEVRGGKIVRVWTLK